MRDKSDQLSGFKGCQRAEIYQRFTEALAASAPELLDVGLSDSLHSSSRVGSRKETLWQQVVSDERSAQAGSQRGLFTFGFEVSDEEDGTGGAEAGPEANVHPTVTRHVTG